MPFSLKGRLPATRHRPLVRHRCPLQGIIPRRNTAALQHGITHYSPPNPKSAIRKRGAEQEKRKAPDSRQALTQCVMKKEQCPLGGISLDEESLAQEGRLIQESTSPKRSVSRAQQERPRWHSSQRETSLSFQEPSPKREPSRTPPDRPQPAWLARCRTPPKKSAWHT